MNSTRDLFALHPRPPFRLDFTVFALRRNAVNIVDRWEASVYRRLFVIDGRPAEIAVEQTGPRDAPGLAVSLTGREAGRGLDEEATELLRRVLGLDVDLTPFYRRVALDKRLGPLVERFKGLKPPVIPTVFETLLSAIACQQLSLIAGMHLLVRFSEAYGMALDGHRAFPRPADLRRAQPSDLRAIGFSMRKSETILYLAHDIDTETLDVEGLADLDTGEVIERLRALPGVGRWTAQYVALRALRRLDAFPIDDIGGQNKLQRLLDLPRRPDADETASILEPWRPYQGLIYFFLLLDSLS